MEKEWREFEKLIERIERQLGPKGAEVKSPDHIIDRITGQLREVDVSIRYKIGSTSILIAIECRKRDRPQDVTWIEQLATKKRNIGANQIIAVSSESFSGPAIKSADAYGIELRLLQDITDQVIENWINSIQIEKLKLNDTVEDWRIEVEGDEISFSEDTRELLRDSPFEGKFIGRREDGIFLSIADFINSFYRWQSEGKLGQDSYAGLTEGESKVRRSLTICFSPGKFFIRSDSGEVDVKEIEIILRTKIEREAVPINQVYSYSDIDNQITEIAVARASLGGQEQNEVLIFIQPLRDPFKE